MTMVSSTMLTSPDGVVEYQTEENNYLGIFSTFLISNIPTVILGGIYLSERNKINMRKSVDKMKIDDL